MNKDQIKAKTNELIDKTSAEINALEAKRAEVSGAAAEKYNQTIKALKSERDALAEKLNSLLETSGEAWDNASGDFEKSLKSFQSGVKKMVDAF
ncbi:MAG: hypothetical protein JJU02_12410 [Cryomorphaceae bacterium]|nr:hypothetical protein [Cryomorphaceae bacterium]